MRRFPLEQWALNSDNNDYRYKDSRNPVIPGYYYFYGWCNGHLVKELVTVMRDYRLNSNLHVLGVEYGSLMKHFAGFWWGPIMAPWQKDSHFKKLEYVLDEMYYLGHLMMPTDSRPCPLCEYDNGKLIRTCNLHQEMLDLWNPQ